MNKVKLFSYKNLTNDQLINFTLDEMEKLKILSNFCDSYEYERKASLVNQLIIEVKRRNLSIKKPLLAKRIFTK
ncbi:hypothetical protein [Clostridium sp. Cult2]|uniref:hypothetical protein n=1 Tax=Clostridium sp. Cult2 TaxID=2079003 RepID=UPI001F24E0B7|nr:hypothetical protein [Clostridium sp. Cult2]MCF6466025.1 hypothetical protein [Clostridium sp. Cult2]